MSATADETLLHESRVRMRQVALATAGGVLLVAALAIQSTGAHTTVSELTLDLITVNKRVPLDQIGSALNLLGLLAVALTLTFLLSAARARRPEMKDYIKYAAIAGAVIAGLSGLVYFIVIAVKSHQFVTQGAQTYPQANSLTKGGVLPIVQILAPLGSLLLAIGFVLISLNAMRVGLLTRLLGYLGVFAGVLFIIPFGAFGQAIQAGWLLTIAYLISGRWPNGVPPAWVSGRAEPWPTAQEAREQRIRATGRSGRAAPAPAPAGRGMWGGRRAPAPAPEPAPDTTQSARTRSTTPKRKRKRRR